MADIKQPAYITPVLPSSGNRALNKRRAPVKRRRPFDRKPSHREQGPDEQHVVDEYV